MKLNVKAFALSTGVVLGIAVFAITFWFLIFGHQGATLIKLANIYLGYSVTWYGAFIGFIWGFIDGCIGGALIAYFYNLFAGSKS